MHPLIKRVLLPEDLKPLNSIQEYKARGGLKGLERARSMKPLDVIAEIKKSGLRGRGGAGFPTAIKWQTVLDQPDAKKYVVCNCAEGEPGTYKDRYLLSKNPYMVFEGMLIAAHVINAPQVIIVTKEKFKKLVPVLERAIKEYEAEGLAPKGFIRLVLGPDEYLLGEEKALLEVVDGRWPMPRLFPPFMYGAYVGPNQNNPSIVNNVESYSHVANILGKGPEFFRQNGSEDTPGTVILTLTGDVKNPGMYEVATGLTVRQFLYELGGGPISDKPIKAVFSGVSNRVMTPDQFDLKMDFGTLRGGGVGLGSSGFMVYDESRWMVDIAWMFSKFLSKASCGQCIPCNSGTRIITEHLEKLRNGVGTTKDIEAIYVEVGRCTNQTRCFLPQQEQIVIPSIMKKFSKEFEPEHYSQVSKYNRDIKILKVEYFDDEAWKFTIEANPIEFR